MSDSESLVTGVRKYKGNQEEHHRRKRFDDEFEGFMKRARFQRVSAKADTQSDCSPLAKS